MEEKNYVCKLFISKHSRLYVGQHQLLLLLKSVDAYWYIKLFFLSLFVIRNVRGTCSYNEIRKGYMAIESLGTLVLNLNLGDRL